MQISIRKIVTNMSLMLVSIVICLIFLEFCATKFLNINYFTFDGVSPVLDDELRRQFKVFDEKLGFKPGPDWQGRDGMYGCQNGKEYENVKFKDYKNILILGDSVVQSRYLEKSLHAILQYKNFKIWNAGIGAYNSLQEVSYLKKYIKIKPDILILGFCLNDFAPPFIIVSNKDKKMFAQSLFEPMGYVNPFLFRQSALYRYFKLKSLALKNNPWVKEIVIKNKGKVKKSLEELLNYCVERNTTLIVIIYPHLQNYYVDDFLNQAHISIVEILEELKIKYIDLHRICKEIGYDVLKEKPNDTCHLNAKGHFIAAKELTNKFHSEFGLSEQDRNRISSLSYEAYEKENFNN